MIDIHCHILPGIDDGPPDLAASLEMCRQAVADGIETIVATPHVNDIYRPSRDDISRAADELRSAVAEAGLPLQIITGADVSALVLCAQNPAYVAQMASELSIAGNGYLLFEPPHNSMPEWINDILFTLRSAGLNIILTHPERNAEVQADPNLIVPLVQSGVLVQITADSILGLFGHEAMRCAGKLLKMRAVHFIASDSHSPDYRTPHLYEAAQKAGKYLAEDAFKLVRDNPQAAISRGIVEIPEPQASVSWFKRLTSAY